MPESNSGSRWRFRRNSASASHERHAIAEQSESEDEFAVQGFVWTLFFFKIATVVATLWAAGFTREASYLLSITTWPWLIIPIIAISGPIIFHYRLRRVRARRNELQRSEWMIDDQIVSRVGDAPNARRLGSRFKRS
jgi:hypothetical protein